MAQSVKSLPATWETQVQSQGWEDPVEKAMATHSSALAWTEEPGGLRPQGDKELDTTEKWVSFTFSIDDIWFASRILLSQKKKKIEIN